MNFKKDSGETNNTFMVKTNNFILRDYQHECVDTILKSFNKLKSQIVQLPTGAGKTVILWHVLQALEKRALIVAPTRELLEQLYDTGVQVVDPKSVYVKKKSYWPKNSTQYLIMTTQGATFAMKGNDLDAYDAEILIVDEAHRSRSSSLEKLIKHFLDKGRMVLGLTATPERLDGKSLLTIYEELTYKITLIDLIHENHLVDLECYKIKTKQKIVDMKYQLGDIAPSVLNQLDIDARNKIILDIYKNRCPGTKCLVFCLNVSHAEKMADQFEKHGIRAACIHGAQSKNVRKWTLEKFKSGEIRVLCNCQLLTEGFDEPSIQSLILARPTKSKALYCQMIGRGVRPHPDKVHCLVYDLSDEIHNICSFNALGGIPSGDLFEWQNGETLTSATDRYKLSIDDVEYDYEKHDLYQKDPSEILYAVQSQKELLSFYHIPFLNDITMDQAAYLLWKNAAMRKNGIDSENYWKKWRHVEMPGEIEGART